MSDVATASAGLTSVEHWIDGRTVVGSDHRVWLDAPDNAPLYYLADATSSQVELAIASSKRAQRDWRRATASERARILTRAAEWLVEQRDKIAHCIVQETGKPIRQARGEVQRAASSLEYFSHHAASEGHVVTEHSLEVWGVQLEEPIGTVAIICSWNLPLQLCALKAGAALAAGCSVIIKPSPFAARASAYLVEALHIAGLPPGCASLLQGGDRVGEWLVHHPGIDAVSFTGSDKTAVRVMRAASEYPKKLVLELGGRSANVVFGDAPLSRAARGVVSGIARNQGATCTAGTRVLIESSIIEEMLDLIVAELDGLCVGDPFEETTDVGAIRHKQLYERIRAELDSVTSRGGRIYAGGNDVTVLERGGRYMEPAIILGLPNDDRVCREELFGPVAAIVPFEGVDDAVALVNDNDYGLAAGIWSRDIEKLERVWRELDVGTIYVNSYHRRDGIPLTASGRKRSGFGHEGSKRGIDEFRVTKSIHFPRM